MSNAALKWDLVSEPIRFSVIVPTFNRAHLLADALRSICAVEYPSARYEIIVVDNGSSDDTKAVVARFDEGPEHTVRYVLEPQRGYQFACNRGAVVARGELLAYTDDDAEVTPGWLRALDAAYQGPHVGMAGGRVCVKWKTAPPSWVRGFGAFPELDYGPEPMTLSWPQTIFGANLSIRKELLLHVGGFNPSTSMDEEFVGDGETGLCRKVYAAGWTIAWAPQALVNHVHDGASVTLRYVQHREAQQARFACYQAYKLRRHSAPELLVRGTIAALRSVRLKAVGSWRWALTHAIDHGSEIRASAHAASAVYYGRLLFSATFRDAVVKDHWLVTGDDLGG